jgi:hypothetical protein
VARPFLVEQSDGFWRSIIGGTISGRASLDFNSHQRATFVADLRRVYGLDNPKLLPVPLRETEVTPVPARSTLGVNDSQSGVMFPSLAVNVVGKAEFRRRSLGVAMQCRPDAGLGQSPPPGQRLGRMGMAPAWTGILLLHRAGPDAYSRAYFRQELKWEQNTRCQGRSWVKVPISMVLMVLAVKCNSSTAPLFTELSDSEAWISEEKAQAPNDPRAPRRRREEPPFAHTLRTLHQRADYGGAIRRAASSAA